MIKKYLHGIQSEQHKKKKKSYPMELSIATCIIAYSCTGIKILNLDLKMHRLQMLTQSTAPHVVTV